MDLFYENNWRVLAVSYFIVDVRLGFSKDFFVIQILKALCKGHVDIDTGIVYWYFQQTGFEN